MKRHKKSILKVTLSLLVIAGSFSSCKQNDIDMSKIDFSNVENLYAQPLPVIQKCVEGKWKWYISSGGAAGLTYPTNTFLNVMQDSILISEDDSITYTFTYKWKRKGTPSGYTTYVVWNNEQDIGYGYFESIKNDTLLSESFNGVFYNVFLKVK